MPQILTPDLMVFHHCHMRGKMRLKNLVFFKVNIHFFKLTFGKLIENSIT